MAFQPESLVYESGIYQLETADPVVGGVGGIANTPLLQLANRTKWLKSNLDGLLAGTVIPPGVAPLASPLFTGDPRGPTPAASDNDTSFATTNFVQRNSGGVLVKNVAGNANVTLTADEAAYPIIELSGALTGNINIIVPTAMTDRWIFDNDTSGAFTVTVKAATGAGVGIPQGYAMECVWDGTNVFGVSGIHSVPTQAKFTNNLTPASTQFVKQSGVQFAGFSPYSAGSSIVAADSGGVVLLNGNDGLFTLPPANSLRRGDIVVCQANGWAGKATVQRAGSDIIYPNGIGGGQTSITIDFGDALWLMSEGVSTWYVIGAPAEHSGGWAKSHAASGYQKLPSGLIIQWGTTSTSGTADVAVTFPIAFPTACRSIACMPAVSGAGVFADYNSLTATGFNIAGWSSSSVRAAVPVPWLAIGV